MKTLLLLLCLTLSAQAQLTLRSAHYPTLFKPSSSLPLTPEAFGTVQLFTNPEGMTGLSDGDTTNRLYDFSGNEFHSFQTTAGYQPLYKTGANGINGKAVFQYDATDDFWSISNCLTSLTAGTLFVVMQLTADPPSDSAKTGFGVFGSATGAGNSPHWPFTDGVVYDSFGVSTRLTVGNPSQNMASSAVVVAIVAQAADYRFYVDNTLVGSAGGGFSQGFRSTPELGRSTIDGTYHFNGKMGPLIIMNGALSDSNRTNLSNQLKAIYGTN